MQLTDDDVRAILKLLETSPFSDLELETPDFRLTLRRAADGAWTSESATLKSANLQRPANDAATGTDAQRTDAQRTDAQRADAKRAESAADARPDLIEVRTPLPGTFYRSPKPGAPPFVELGSEVAANTVVAIVETMKLMNSVYAGVAGRVAEICLGDASFAEQDLVLMRIAPDRQ
jgi:acetyl-CoA carboxylase biotin carboxyl carrier protein